MWSLHGWTGPRQWIQDGMRVHCLNGDTLERVRILHVGEKGTVVGPAAASFSNLSVAGMLDAWLNDDFLRYVPAVCAYGLRKGAKEAQELLRRFWISVSEQSLWPENPIRNMFPEDSPNRWNVDLNPLAIGFGMAEQITSPYLNPWGSH